MRLTKREGIILIIVMFVGLNVLFYNFVVTPLQKDRKSSESDKEVVLEEERKIKDLALQIQVLNKELEKIEKSSADLYKNMFEIWDQAENLVYVEGLTQGLCDRTTINSYTPVDIDSFQTADVSLNLVTNYENLHKILKNFEEGDYACTVNGITISVKDREPSESDWMPIELDVELNMRFYAKEQVYEYPKDYDFLGGSYKKDNLFSYD